ncbi:DUF5675 family protein [Mesonia aestuariivivens]|uniref:DUF5675 domain-containing protein n=1 Tax=Mesonia aestuariivivens TaxID=2796128 RepID=A0ABS6W7A3_9FLAO|nr:DUF5675 family protein [Mesonia aestuariivivens]MBW2962999.1 hypothetical protein [Mesonia aestuariivivens]
MELLLKRSYHAQGCTGELFYQGNLLCYTIELPWKENQAQISCIPKGTYNLEKRFSKKFGWHLLIKEVPKRSFILFHPANNALKELRGCIAPVSTLTAPGKGIQSRIAFHKLKQVTYAHFAKREVVTLTIQ